MKAVLSFLFLDKKKTKNQGLAISLNY